MNAHIGSDGKQKCSLGYQTTAKTSPCRQVLKIGAVRSMTTEFPTGPENNSVRDSITSDISMGMPKEANPAREAWLKGIKETEAKIAEYDKYIKLI